MGIRSWLKKSQAKILANGWRLALYTAYNQIYDNPVYFAAFAYFGVTRGWALMTAISLIQCGIMFWHYDQESSDWLLVKAVNSWDPEYQESEEESWFERTRLGRSSLGIAIVWLLSILSRLFFWVAKWVLRFKKGRYGPLAILVLVLRIDPLVVAVHFKTGRKGANLRDWSVLVLSVLLGNLYWGIQIGLLVKLLVWAKSLL